MNKIEVLSVNPSENTLGALNPEVASTVARSSRIIGNRSDTLIDDTVNFLTAVKHPSAMRLGTALLLLRVAFGVLLIVSGCFSIPSLYTIDSLAALQPYWLGILQIAVGASFCLGFATRLVSLAGLLTFGTIAAFSITSFPEATATLSEATSNLASTVSTATISLNSLSEAVSNLSQATALLPQTALLYTFACFVFFILGAGRISVDGLTRKHTIIMRQRRKSRLAKKRLSYQAFQYSSAH